MLSTLHVIEIIFLFISTDWSVKCPFDIYVDGITGIMYKVLKTSPWVFWVGANAMVHIVWVTVLLSCQLYQVGLTIMLTLMYIHRELSRLCFLSVEAIHFLFKSSIEYW